MKNKDKTKESLIYELKELRRRIAELEASKAQLKRANEELQKIEGKYQSIFEDSRDAIYITTREGKMVDVNQAALDLFSYTRKELIALDIRGSIINPIDRKMFQQEIEQKGFSKDYEVKLQKKNGEEMDCLLTSTVRRDKDGSILGYQGIIRDISEQRWAEKEIRKLSSAVEQSINAIAMADLDGDLTYVNDSFLKMWGYDDVKEVLRKPAVKFWQVETKASDAVEALRNKGEWVGELVAMKKDGSFFDALLSASMVVHDTDSPLCMMASFVDVTERKRVRKALQASEEKYKTLFENASDAIFIADTKTDVILDANRQAEQLIGRPRQEIIGMHQSDLHVPQHAEYYKEKFREHVEKGRVLDLEAEVIKKDGSIVPVFISSSVIRLHGKEVIQGLFRDISQEKMILDLKEEIAARKLIEKAKGILMDRREISEKEAMRRLQKESRTQRRKIKEIAQGVISSQSILS